MSSTMPWVLAIAFCLGGICVMAQQASERMVNPTLPGDETPGRMHCELRWADRMAPPAQVWFDDLTGWTMQRTRGNADVGLRASIAQRLWRDQTAKFTYHHGTERTTVVVRPPKPVAIENRFDAARMWVFGGWYNRATDDANPPEITLLLKDRAGQEVRIGFGAVTAGNWTLEQGVLPKESLDPSKFPMAFVGMEIDQVDFINGQSDMHFECIEFYQQDRRPWNHPFKQRNAIFPTSDEGFLPTPPADVKTSVRRDGKGAMFVSEAGGTALRFRVDPDKGVFEGIEAQWADGQWFNPASGGTLKGVDISGAKITSAKIEDGALVVVWTAGNGDRRLSWQARYFIKGRTLVIDVSSKGGQVEGIDVGEIAGLAGVRGIFVPYMALNRITHLTTEGPLIACSDDVFVSVLPDVFNSDFSNLVNDASKDWQPKNGKLRIITGTEYQTLTDGKRLDLRDRFLITVSDEFADVLPNARNPVSPNREKLAPYLHFMAYVPHERMLTTFKRYGMDNVIADHHAWTHFLGDGYKGLSSFSYRWRPREDTSIRDWQRYSQAIIDLGFINGMYAYFPDLVPLNEYWDEDKVALNQNGSLRPGWWYGNYFVKLNDAARLAANVCELIKDLYRPSCVYLDIHTVIGPSACEYEAGVENAGTARGTILANLDLIAEVRKHIGATVGEGYHRWLYAGVSDVDYSTLLHPSRYGSASGVPLLIDFDRLKIAPFEHGTMMGFEPKYFLGEQSKETEQVYKNDTAVAPPDAWYKYITASLAYGHMGALGYDYLPSLNRMIHLYALMQGVQSEYLTDNSVSVEYHNGETFLQTNDAIRADAVKNGRLRVTYSKGLVVIVNYNDQPWTITSAGGRSYELPAYGWVIEKPGEILAYSALHEGNRVDVVKCPSYIYVNTGGHAFKDEALGLEVTGALWLKHEQDGAWRAIPCGDLGPWEKFSTEKFPKDQYDFRLNAIPEARGMSHCVIDTSKLVGKPASQLLGVAARDADGNDVQNANVKVENDRLHITPQADVVDYVLK